MTSKFYFSLFLYSAIIAFIFYFAEPLLPVKVVFPSFWIIQVIMIVATLLFHYGMTKAAKAGGQQFVRYFMGATSAKLMVFLMIMIIYGLLHKGNAFGFILHFFVFYLLYTVFEVTFAYKNFGVAKGNRSN